MEKSTPRKRSPQDRHHDWSEPQVHPATARDGALVLGAEPGQGAGKRPGSGARRRGGRRQPHLVRLKEAAAAAPQDPNLRRRRHGILGPWFTSACASACAPLSAPPPACAGVLPAPRHRALCACALRSCPPRLRSLLALGSASLQHDPMRVRPALRPASTLPPARAGSPPVRLGDWLGFLGPQGSAYACCPFGRCLGFSSARPWTRCLSPGHLPSTPEPALPRGLFGGLEVARAGPQAAAAGPASACTVPSASPRRLVNHMCLTIQTILSKDS